MTLPANDRTAPDRQDPGPKVAAHHASGEGIARVPYPIRTTHTTVRRSTLLNPSMLRLTLTGSEVAEFHSYQADDHVRIVLALPDGTRNDPRANVDGTLDWLTPHPPSRKYTIRRVDREALELDLDLVVHPGGLVSEWAAALSPGDEVLLAGPPGAKAFGQSYDHFVFAVDSTGLPALARWLEEAPEGVSGEAFIDVDHAHERQYPLPTRAGVPVHWLDRSTGSRLADAVRTAELPQGRVFLFAAGEAGDLKPLRGWARERRIPALVTGYWKRGVADLDD